MATYTARLRWLRPTPKAPKAAGRAFAAAALPDYSTQTKAALVALATDRGLDASGTKADLIARLSDG